MSRISTLLGAVRSARRLARHDAWTPGQLRDHQRTLLTEIVAHARCNSPYYRERLAGLPQRADVEPGAVPPLDKATMLDNFDRLVTDPVLRLADLERHVAKVRDQRPYLGRYHVMASGGTSGRRGIFVYGPDDWRECLAGLVRNNESFLGITARLPRRRIAAVTAVGALHMTARMGASLDAGVHRMLRIDARRPLGEICAELQRFQPEALVAYASIASLLADAQLNGQLRIAPRVVQATSEVLTPDMRSRIERAWGSEPFNLYASTETGILAVECERHQGLHLCADQALLEVVDADGREVAPGVAGDKVLVTNLVNRTQPLIRYELTDLVTLATEPCACGRPYPLIMSVDGRCDDILTLSGVDGRRIAVHPLTLRSPLAQVDALVQYRVIHDIDGLTIEAVFSGNHEEEARNVENVVRTAIDRCGAVQPPVRVLAVPAIARHAVSGKLKLVESRVTH